MVALNQDQNFSLAGYFVHMWTNVYLPSDPMRKNSDGITKFDFPIDCIILNNGTFLSVLV